MSEGLEISDLILALSSGIREAAEKSAAESNNPVVQLAGCEVELTVTAKLDGKAGVKFWLIDVGGGKSSENVSRIKLQFVPPKGVTIQAVQASKDKNGPQHKRKQKD
tara:strand:- start:649 stop:969 length:321 start_codon:yes stop_codon:yes gene_type:complete